MRGVRPIAHLDRTWGGRQPEPRHTVAVTDGSLRFVNHTSKPNAEFFGRDLYATKTIRAGDEITIHYGEEWVGVS